MSRQSPVVGADDSQVPHPIQVRDLSRARLDTARRLWEQGTPGTARREIGSALTLSALAHHWGEVAGPDREGLALAAVGSLGRMAAGPASDLDLVVLHDGVSRAGMRELEDLATRLWYPVWDAGLSLDWSMRSLAECRQVASRNLPAAAGLLSLHPVAGDRTLVTQAKAAIYRDWRSAARGRLPELLNASRSRAVRNGELASLIEPNIKESRGGLRDYESLTGLAATWLADRPRGAVDHAAGFLLDVRDAMHLVAGRSVVILGRHLAEDVATMLGMDHPDTLLRSLAEAGRTIAHAVDVTQRRARRSAERSRVGSRAWIARQRRGAPRHTIVSPGLIDVDGELALAPGADPGADPMLGLRAAAVAATTGAMITPGLVERLLQCPPLPLPWPGEARDMLLRVLNGPHVVQVWETIDLAGLWVAWIPWWREVRNRPQRSPVHRYTVDRHLMETVVQAQALRRDAPDPDLLILAALLHDIGKRPGADDHSSVGADLMSEIAAHLGFTEREGGDLELLVRHHLVLADLATTKDHDDPAVVRQLWGAVGGRRDLLITLRLLTQADALAVGPKAWSSWREALIEGLYRRALSAPPLA